MDTPFLPVTREEMDGRGWDRVDFVCVTGDAYVDHPSFGIAIISRLLESQGFRVAVLSQPDWKSREDFTRFGRPRLGFLITAGNVDSMVNGYAVSGRPRDRDVYSPGGRPRRRPDRASIVYAVRAREAYKGVPIILGGLEASLRRLAHYDYWDNKVRRSILLDAKADLVVYGMGEIQVAEIAARLAAGDPVGTITGVPGTVYATSAPPDPTHTVVLPAFEEVRSDQARFAESFRLQYANTDPITGRRLAEPYGEGGGIRWVVQNPPAKPLAGQALDAVYELPYARDYHPMYREEGGVPAIEEVKFSLVSSRGCFGSCAFCALTFHQGRHVSGRSHESIAREAVVLTQDAGFKGYIHDVGGPTANFRFAACARQEQHGACAHRECLAPEPCPRLRVDHSDYLTLLRGLRKLPGVKKVFVRSGIRFDYLLADPDRSFLTELCEHHVSGQLKVAPEHVSARVLQIMGKPRHGVYREFESAFVAENRRLGRKQYLVPYFISSHPGSDLAAAIELAEYFRDHKFIPEQVQDFYPTPGTLATCMYHTGVDPRTGEAVYVARTPHEKAMQRALMHYRNPRNHRLVHEALIAAGRRDLIGLGPRALIPPPGARSGSSRGGDKKTARQMRGGRR